ncbi:TIGR04255 family protein [Streptomyces sp. NBC_01794]|uniref:TIGR04255 family protein n=1 Tax=Streptomyces sp. NBC_01794 TaxID=2975942 RepID=UPI003085224F|nr:TIGR04255 family protein [Streptomyces sp. NBC_01794]
MPLTLPSVDPRPLRSPPLAVVVFQVRFEQNLRISDGTTGLMVHERLGGRTGRYPRIEPQQVITSQFEINPAAGAQSPPTSVPMRGWRMRSEDSGWVVTLMPDTASLETTSYTTWRKDFQGRILELLTALAEHVNPQIEERVGLRYVNKVIKPGAVGLSDFRDVIAPGLLGPAGDTFWADGIQNAQQLIEVTVENEIEAKIRHGGLRDNRGKLEGYLLDNDFYRAEPQSFDVSRITSLADRLNNAAAAIFQQSLHSDFLETLY